MSALVLDGKATAKTIRDEISDEVSQWIQSGKPTPTLAAVLVGDDPASQVYVRNKERACEKAGMRSILHRRPASTSTAELLELLSELNADSSVNGILVQLPLPSAIDSLKVLDAVAPEKDVDAFAPEDVGLMVQGRPRFLPCTPHGVLQVLARHQISVEGKHVVVVGRSDIVGKPLANMLVAKDLGFGASYANATVTLCHSKTDNMKDITRQADILIAAVGRAELITADMVKPDAVVIDVGINRVGDKLVGDVAYAEVAQKAAAITPVPGGIGPLTIAMLLRNTLTACKQQNAS